MYLKDSTIKKRYSIFPIIHKDLWDKYKEVEKQIWVAEETPLDKDKFDELSDNEKIYLKNILGFFTISDGLVIDNIAANFLREVDILEAQYFYGQQILIEQVHANGYSLLVDTYIKDINEKEALFDAMSTNQAIHKKAAWAEKWIEHPSFPQRLLAFACVEGISFSSVFAGVFWFRSRNKMPGLGDMNELILRDETAHYNFAVHLYNNYLKEEYQLPKEEIRKIILGCYDIEKAFIEESMPDGLQGLTKADMIKYVQFVTDIVLTDFNCEAEFKINNPLDYMSRIGLSSKNNFFEKRVGEYTRVDIPTTSENLFDEDF
jgi:ribonucleoside-diphosphate reductase beta chain